MSDKLKVKHVKPFNLLPDPVCICIDSQINSNREPRDRRKYQHERYLLRKYPGLSLEQAKFRELECSRRLGENRFKRHKRWFNHYLKQRPGLQKYIEYMDDDWTSSSTPEEISHAIDANILRQFRRNQKSAFSPESWKFYYSSDLWHQTGQYLEPLWKPSKSKLGKLESRRQLKEFLANLANRDDDENKDDYVSHANGYDVSPQ